MLHVGATEGGEKGSGGVGSEVSHDLPTETTEGERQGNETYHQPTVESK